MRGVRRKGAGMGVKRWMVVLGTGECRPEDVDKHTVMRRTGLRAHDLRALDPMLSNPSTILVRENAIVVNIEHIKAIITAKEVLTMDSSNPLFLSLLQDLQVRLSSSNYETPFQMSNDMDNDHEEKWNNPQSAQGVQTAPVTKQLAPVLKQLPFEFKALEACIESACTCLEYETRTLEEEAYPVLDKLTSQISTPNLKRVRQIKDRLVTLSGRVQKIADQLEHLLDDDNVMAEMYLTQKLEAGLLDEASLKEGDDAAFEDDDQSYGSNSVKDECSGPVPNVKELEMLLEAYFSQINGILQKLSSLSEYVNDTQDYINIMLDDKRNQLLRAAVILNTLNMMVNAGIVVVGLFGMNIHIELFDGKPAQFWAKAGGTFGGCILLFFIAILWGKKKYLLPQ